jgi:hypothetical protein
VPTTMDGFEERYETQENVTMPIRGYSIKVARIFNDSIHESCVFNYIIDSEYEGKGIESVMININYDDLFDDKTGIYAIGDVLKEYQQGNENYFKKGTKWERACEFQYLNKKGVVEYTAKSGLSIFGYISRKHPQKSLKLSAKKKYGNKKFKHQFFQNGPQACKRLILRSAFSGWKGGIYQDCFVSEACKDLNFEVGCQKPVSVFMNGEYWGIHFLTEKIDRFYLQDHFKLNTDSVHIVRDNGRSDNGKADSYKAIKEFIKKNDLKIKSNYNHFCDEMDVDNMIDWYIAETFFQNEDWPCNNTKLWKQKSDTAKWRNFLVDMDATMISDTLNALNRFYNFTNLQFHNRRNRCSVIFQNLLRNVEFQEQFYNRYVAILNNEFSSIKLNSLFKKYQELFDRDNILELNQERWDYPDSGDFEDAEDTRSDWVVKRQAIALSQLKKFMKQVEVDAELPFVKYL